MEIDGDKALDSAGASAITSSLPASTATALINTNLISLAGMEPILDAFARYEQLKRARQLLVVSVELGKHVDKAAPFFEVLATGIFQTVMENDLVAVAMENCSSKSKSGHPKLNSRPAAASESIVIGNIESTVSVSESNFWNLKNIEGARALLLYVVEP